MAVVVSVSNFAVQYPINDWLTWAAFTYPFSFLVTDLTNRTRGSADARTVVFAGFACGVIVSALLATPRIALASGSAFLFAQLFDIFVFHKLRSSRQWWRPPLVSSILGSTLDTGTFFTIAFVGTEVPWPTLALGDLATKFCFALTMLVFYRIAMPFLPALLPTRATRA